MVLRQGDPISPYLFTLVMEVFNIIMSKNIKDSFEYGYHFGCKELKLSHFCFDDDLLVLCKGNKGSLEVVKKSLDEFSQVSGLNLNLGMIQLLASVLSSMQIYWASVYLLPNYVVKDLDKFIGNSQKISVFYDKWCSNGPLCEFISKRAIYDARIKDDVVIADMMIDNNSQWPDGCQSIPRYAFILWLAIQGKFMTQDRMGKRHNIANLADLKCYYVMKPFDLINSNAAAIVSGNPPLSYLVHPPLLKLYMVGPRLFSLRAFALKVPMMKRGTLLMRMIMHEQFLTQKLYPSEGNSQNDSNSIGFGLFRDEPQTEVRRSTRLKVRLVRFNDFVVNSNSVEPKSYIDACNDENWINAINQEMKTLHRNNTWVLAEFPTGRKAIGSKWIFKIKYKASGEIDRYKARLVAQGFGQREDVNNDFLSGNLYKEVYMALPPGFYDKNETKVCKLVRFLYGLKQAPRQWNAKLTCDLLKNEFIQSKNDYSLYVKSKKGLFIALLVYVDDIVITGNDLTEIENFKGFLSSNFMIKILES
ncbi:ribonuclease H-like domain-containing protein [Tanacetum coccineum]